MRVCRFDNDEMLSASCIKALREVATGGYDRPVGIMLTGGTTPTTMIDMLKQAPFTASPRVHLFLSDERHVDRECSQSNYWILNSACHALQVCEEQQICVDTSLPLEIAAGDYSRKLDSFIASGATLPLGLLGLGTDGHLASLFSMDDVIAGTGRWAIPVIRPAPPHRVSVTVDLLMRVERIIFAVAGAKKTAIIRKLIRAPASVLAGKALAGHPNLELWFAN